MRYSPEQIERFRAARVAQVPPFEDRFWSKVDKSAGPDGCWPWLAHVQTRGYGQFHVAVIKGRCIRMPAHRVAWVLAKDTIPPGKVLDHICKNTKCVNPAHLRPVLQRENCMELARPTPFYSNKLKTHCKFGHPFDGANTVWHKRPQDGGPTRVCAACRPWARNSVYRIEPPPRQDTVLAQPAASATEQSNQVNGEEKP
jgi:hypothetical protein